MSEAQQSDLPSCEECGATVYPEHVLSGSAGKHEGRLLCPYCMREAVQAEIHVTANVGEDSASSPQVQRSSKIRYNDGTLAGSREEQSYRRPLHHQRLFATRCKTFHCKMNDASVAHLDKQINEWVDANEDVEIKFATSIVGNFVADSHLVVTVFY